ncbi:MAG: hypothetical protein LBL24_05735 [Bacteroidales bacterium]|jgi:hypothetical protein|nr:hypothetical protein [Bacteroidales bacterium]
MMNNRYAKVTKNQIEQCILSGTIQIVALRIKLISPLQALQGLAFAGYSFRRALPCAIDYALSELFTSSDHDWATPCKTKNIILPMASWQLPMTSGHLPMTS